MDLKERFDAATAKLDELKVKMEEAIHAYKAAAEQIEIYNEKYGE